MPTMTARNNSKKPLTVTPINASMYQDSFDLLSASRDFSDQYQPMAETRFTTSESLRAPDMKFPPNRTQSSRFADRALPPSSVSRSPTMKSILGPRTPAYDPEAQPIFSPKRDVGAHSVDIVVSNMGYAEVPAEKPRSLGPPVYDVPNNKSFKMHKLKEPSLEDEWNDIVAEKKGRFRDFCCCMFSSSILVLIAAGILVMTLYFIMRPSAPKIYVENINITNFKLLAAKASEEDPLIQTGMTFLVRIKNPNKFATVHHKSLNVTLNYKDEVLGHILVPGFRQSVKAETEMPTTVPKTVARIEDRVDAINLLDEINDSNVRLELRGTAEGNFRILGINVKKLDAPLYCILNVKPEIDKSPAEVISHSCYTSV